MEDVKRGWKEGITSIRGLQDTKSKEIQRNRKTTCQKEKVCKQLLGIPFF